MFLSISERVYDHKPTDEEIRAMRFQEREITPSSLASLISSGHCYAHIYRHKGYTLTMKEKTKPNFLFTNAVIIDIDDSEYRCTMDDVLEGLEYKPTIVHTTPSNGTDGWRYRLIYLFNDNLPLQDYTLLYDHICESIGRTSGLDAGIDRRGEAQYYNGCLDCMIIVNEDAVYSREQFPHVIQVSIPQVEYTVTVTDNDYWNRYTTATAGVMYESGDDRYWLLKDDHYTIDRRWVSTEDGRRTVGKWQPGSSRKKRLYATALILKYNDIHNGNEPDSDWLAWSLWQEYSRFYEQHPGIDYKWITTLANDVVNSDRQPDKQEHPSFKVKPGTGNRRSTAKQVDWERRKGYSDQDILAVYDPSLSLRNNIKIMNELNYKISVESLRRLLKRNNLPTDTTTKPGTDDCLNTTI